VQAGRKLQRKHSLSAFRRKRPFEHSSNMHILDYNRLYRDSLSENPTIIIIIISIILIGIGPASASASSSSSSSSNFLDGWLGIFEVFFYGDKPRCVWELQDFRAHISRNNMGISRV